MKTGFIGPATMEWQRPKRKVCNQCDYCDEMKIYGGSKHELLMASCKHPDRKNDSFTMLFGHPLEVSGDDVLWPDDCPQPVQVLKATGEPV